jgi:hypothetical protein
VNTKTLKAPEMIAGRLAYIAPEHHDIDEPQQRLHPAVFSAEHRPELMTPA